MAMAFGRICLHLPQLLCRLVSNPSLVPVSFTVWNPLASWNMFQLKKNVCVQCTSCWQTVSKTPGICYKMNNLVAEVPSCQVSCMSAFQGHCFLKLIALTVPTCLLLLSFLIKVSSLGNHLRFWRRTWLSSH